MESKKEIRKRILECRDSLTMEERTRGDILITERILGHQWFYRAEEILGFVNYGSEISTMELLEVALKRNQKLYLPKICADGDMRFYRVRKLEELQPGYRGIREPSGESEEYQYQENRAENTLMLMPGVAFDIYRNRLGYGKGFYDRYLKDKTELQYRTIAIGYQCQMVEKIPEEECDIRPYQVICV